MRNTARSHDDTSCCQLAPDLPPCFPDEPYRSVAYVVRRRRSTEEEAEEKERASEKSPRVEDEEAAASPASGAESLEPAADDGFPRFISRLGGASSAAVSHPPSLDLDSPGGGG